MGKRDDIDIATFDLETRTTLKKEGATVAPNTNRDQRKVSNKEKNLATMLLNSAKQDA